MAPTQTCPAAYFFPQSGKSLGRPRWLLPRAFTNIFAFFYFSMCNITTLHGVALTNPFYFIRSAPCSGPLITETVETAGVGGYAQLRPMHA